MKKSLWYKCTIESGKGYTKKQKKERSERAKRRSEMFISHQLSSPNSSVNRSYWSKSERLTEGWVVRSAFSKSLYQPRRDEDINDIILFYNNLVFVNMDQNRIECIQNHQLAHSSPYSLESDTPWADRPPSGTFPFHRDHQESKRHTCPAKSLQFSRLWCSPFRQ